MLPYGTVSNAEQGGFYFWVCGWNHKVRPFKWKLLSGTFLRYNLLCHTKWFDLWSLWMKSIMFFFWFLIWNVFACKTIQSNLLRTMLLVRRVRSVFFVEKNKTKQNNNNNRLTHISLTTCRSSDLLFSCRTTSSTCKFPQKSLIFGGLHELRKGDVTQGDSQRWFFAQHSIAMLEECCNHLNRCRNNVAMPCCA